MSDELNPIETPAEEPFTIPNYFVGNAGPDYFSRHLSGFAGQPAKFLQIGVFAGAASAWMLENVLTHPDSVLVDVDTWLGSPEHQGMDFGIIEAEYDNSVATNPRVVKTKMTSDEFFATNNEVFDFVYVDANHSREQKLLDGQNAIDCLVDGGIVAFDDTFDQTIREVVDLLVEQNPGLTQIEESTHQQMWFRINR